VRKLRRGVSATILVTRPEPEAGRTAALLSAAGAVPLLSPLLAVEALAWALPERFPDGVIVTSPRALLVGAAGLAPLLALPCYVAGAATAAVAAQAGFGDVRIPGREGIAGILEMLEQDPAAPRHLLHLAGRDRTPRPALAGFEITVVEAYAAVTVPLSDAAVAVLAAGQVQATLLYSARTARQFGHEIARLKLRRETLSIAALSAGVAAAAGNGWERVSVADVANEAAMFAAIGLSQPSRIIRGG